MNGFADWPHVCDFDDEVLEALQAATAEEVVVTSGSASSSTSPMTITDNSGLDSDETVGDDP